LHTNFQLPVEHYELRPGATIPDVVASQDCGNGPVGVLVSFVGGPAQTAPARKSLLARNSATDTCGVAHPFVQTIFVNCKPGL